MNNKIYLQRIQRDIWTLIFVVFISGYTIFNLSHWRDQGRIFHEDVISYYGYLPAAFIYGDVSLQKPTRDISEVQHMFWLQETPGNAKLFKMSMGMAYMYAPFFFIAHSWETLSGGNNNGFSPPYRFAICMSSLAAILLGLFYLRKVLRVFFNSKVTALTLFLIGLGTNLYFYTVLAVGMPHLYLFALLSVVLYLLSKWYQKPNLTRSILIGLLSGLMILIRPTMVIVVLIIALYDVRSFEDFKSRISFYVTNYRNLLLMGLAIILVWVPQLLYWKACTGSFIFYSYTNEGFFFGDPKLLDVLIGFRKGWLIYTPIMIFGLIGIAIMAKRKHSMTLAILVPVVIYLYIASCWWCWWFGGSFGYRPMIDMYPLMAIALAYFIQYVYTLRRVMKRSIIATLLLLLVLNLFQTRQAHEGLLHHDSMTVRAYIALFGKLKPTITKEELVPMLASPDYNAAMQGNRD